MIGLLIVSHAELGREFLNAAELIVGRLDAADAVSIRANTDCQELLEEIAEKIKALNQGQGVLVLTDMFGGTPSNVSLSFLNDEKVEVLTGVNLPMVIAASEARGRMNLHELGEKAQEAGQSSINLASKLLKSG